MTTERIINGTKYEEHDLKCADCGEPLILRASKYGVFYGCTAFPKCKGGHGAHPSGAPLGTPATKEVKERRIKAHAAFDVLWKSGKMRRNEAYFWLADRLGMPRGQVHIGGFTAEQCDKVLEVMMRFEDTRGDDADSLEY